MADPLDREADKILDEYAEARESYNLSDGKPIFTKRMTESKSKLKSLLAKRERLAEIKGIKFTQKLYNSDLHPDIRIKGRLAELTRLEEEDG